MDERDILENRDFIDKINSNLSKLSIHKDEKIVVAVSGGCDSMALILCLKQLGFTNLLPVIIDHKLRENSTVEAKNVSDYLLKYSLKSEILTWNHLEISSGMEEKARNARYILLLNYCTQNNSKFLLLGHHADDQVETFLLNIARGSGLNGLTAMAMVSRKNGINIVRPMLDIYKQEIKEFLIKNKISWFEDESNQNTEIRRNLLRDILSNFSDNIGLLKSRIIRTIDEMQQLRIVFEQYQEDNFLKVLISLTPQFIVIDVVKFKILSPIEKRYLLSEILMKLNILEKYRPRLEKINQLLGDLDLAILNKKKLRKQLHSCDIFLELESSTIHFSLIKR